MLIIEPAEDLSTSWLRTVNACREVGGKALHVITTVTDPTLERNDVRKVLDEMQETHADGGKYNSVDTVASTIFPADLYDAPDFDWAPHASVSELRILEEAANDLYRDYLHALPIIRSGNSWGTYFQRMIDWNDQNQLARSIEYLRRQRRGSHGKGVRFANSADIALGMEGERTGVQINSPGDVLEIGNPCLVHVDLTIHERRLNLLATYRHWYLMGRAYGNLLGLAQLHQFLAQQSGHQLGELVVVSGMSSVEWRARDLGPLTELPDRPDQR